MWPPPAPVAAPRLCHPPPSALPTAAPQCWQLSAPSPLCPRHPCPHPSPLFQASPAAAPAWLACTSRRWLLKASLQPSTTCHLQPPLCPGTSLRHAAHLAPQPPTLPKLPHVSAPPLCRAAPLSSLSSILLSPAISLLASAVANKRNVCACQTGRPFVCGLVNSFAGEASERHLAPSFFQPCHARQPPCPPRPSSQSPRHLSPSK